MRILLVRPPRIKQAITLGSFMFSEPLGLEMIYGVLKKDHQVKILDMMIQDDLPGELKEFSPHIVGITSLCIDVDRVISLAGECKAFDGDIITMVGGTQTLLSPESFFDEGIDHSFRFSTRDNILELMGQIEDGRIEALDGVLSRDLAYYDTGVQGRNEYLPPDRESTRVYRSHYSYFGYRPAAIMELGLGCGKTCDFCLRWRIEGAREEMISEEIWQEDLLSIKEPTVMFIDNDLFYGSVHGILRHRDKVRKMASLGLKALLVGYETFDDGELVKYRKKSTTDENREAARLLQEIGIDVWASFMAHPDWTREDFRTFRRYIRELAPEISTINPLTPFPGLPLFEKYKDRLLYRVEDYHRWSFGQVMIMPSKMSLRSYYMELLKTYLYINLALNRNTEMIRKYGLINILRILKGSVGASFKYIRLMRSQRLT